MGCGGGGGGFSMFHQLDKVEPICAPDQSMKSIEIMDYLSCWEILALGLSCLFKMLGVQLDLHLVFLRMKPWHFHDLFHSWLVCFLSSLVCCVFNILSGSIGGQPAAQHRPRSD